MNSANNHGGLDTITFAIPGTGVHVISPLSALPTISDPVIVDGTTQTGYATSPLIQIDGNSAGANVTGLSVSAGGNTIKGLDITRFKATGIVLQGLNNNVVENNYIGTDPTGTIAEGNHNAGINILGGSSSNQVLNNLISGNGFNNNGGAGVFISDAGTNDNVLSGNYVGLDVTGTKTLGNEGVGVFLANGVQGTLIGTNGDNVNDLAERNLISGNGFQGIFIQGLGTNGNIVAGNYVGTDKTGSLRLPNQNNGIWILGGAEGNRIGVNAGDADAAGEANLISGNHFSGVTISDAQSTGNVVAGNLIGTDAAGTHAVSNASFGVSFSNGAQSNRIGSNGDGIGDNLERNVIAGNGSAGVYIGDGGTNQNVVAGNYVGTDVTGLKALANHGVGVLVTNGAQSNLIGTDGKSADDAGERNVISANLYQGVAIAGAGTNGNTVAGNFIGINATDTARLGNQNNGIWILSGAQSNLIGTNGTDADAAGEANVIGGNAYSGINISDPGTTANTVAGNFIGIDKTRSINLGNGNWGVGLFNGAQSDVVGGSPALANTIADNRLAGVGVVDATVSEITIRANSIYGNGGLGIDLGSSGVQVDHGGTTAGANNLQNYPVLTAATPGVTTSVGGYLNSLPNTNYTIDFYANPRHDITFYGPGAIYLGSTSIVTDANGNASFSVSLATATTSGQWITATATSAGGDTSEFSGDRPLPFSLPPLSETSWKPIGPGPVAQSPEYTGPVMSGRVTSAAALPGNNNVMYLAADGGGVWKTTDWLDPSPVWTPLTDSQTSTVTGSGNIAYKSLVVAPSSPSTVYAAVEGPGGGILKSTNGGTNWTLLGKALFDRVAFSSLVVDPTNANNLYVTVWYGPSSNSGGVWKSTDGGNSWTNTTSAIHQGTASDIVMDPANPAILYAGLTQDGNLATNGLYETTNAGVSWTLLNTGLPSGAAVGVSIRVALAASAPQNLYATVFNPSTGMPQRFSSTDGGAHWAGLTALPTAEESRTWHAVLSVDPSNPQVVYVNGDHTLYRSADGGLSWVLVNGSEDPVGVFFDNGGKYILVGDHGIYLEGATAAIQLNKQGNTQDSEFYTLTLDPSNPTVAYGIAQDQFSGLKFNNYPVWNALAGMGETGKILVSPSNPNRLYGYDPLAGDNTLMLRSDDAGSSWQAVGSGLPTNLAGYSLAYSSQKAFQLDPSNPDRLVVGTNQVYASTNDGSNWTAISPVLSPSSNIADQYITSLAIAPSDGNTIYVATADGRLFVSQNGRTSWVERDTGLPVDFNDQIVDIKVDPSNPLHAFIVSGTFPNSLFGSTHVWTTTNGGTAWTDITGDLPAEDCRSAIVADWRYATPVLYVGTARGVYSSLNLGTTWTRFGLGMPNSPVTDLQFVPGSDLLAAATYGRGAFEIVVPGPAVSFAVTGPTSITAGAPFTFYVEALDALGNQARPYAGTVHFTSTDLQAVLPANYPFTAADAGVHTFSATLKTAGIRSITATDTVTASITGSASIKVNPGAIKGFTIGYPSSTTAGIAHTLVVTAVDAYGNKVPNYVGTVAFTSSDPQAVLPPNYTFTAADKGTHTFTNGATLKTVGIQTIVATDTVTASITGTKSVQVNAPTLLPAPIPTDRAPRKKHRSDSWEWQWLEDY
jgi:titin